MGVSLKKLFFVAKARKCDCACAKSHEPGARTARNKCFELAEAEAAKPISKSPKMRLRLRAHGLAGLILYA